MKLDVSSLRYLTNDHFRILEAIEVGMKNHELVPVTIITRLAALRSGGVHKIISHLIRNKLIAHEGNAYEGYRLTYSGYDFLALRLFLKKGVIVGLGRQIGVGKESDIYLAVRADGTEIAIKFHRLGRTSFRAVKNKRDYLKNNASQNWFHMSKMSAMKEYSFLTALYEKGFPTPTPFEWNRHAICMSLVQGCSLFQVRKMANAEDIFNHAMDLVVRLAKIGLVHCDFNEFNLMISDDGEELTMIDFPQMISVLHENAEELFNRDVKGVVKFFSRLQGVTYTPDEVPNLGDIIVEEEERLDILMKASGFAGKADALDQVLDAHALHDSEDEEDDELAELKETDDELNDEENEEESPEDSGLTQDHLQKQVRKALEKQSKVRTKSRNASKVSIKGKLFHKCDL